MQICKDASIGPDTNSNDNNNNTFRFLYDDIPLLGQVISR